MKCEICGEANVQECHVFPKEEFIKAFGPRRNHRAGNIIHLCPTHHWKFDKEHEIGILPDRSGFLVWDGRKGEVVKVRARSGSLRGLKDAYVRKRNLSCRYEIRVCLEDMGPGDHP